MDPSPVEMSGPVRAFFDFLLERQANRINFWCCFDVDLPTDRIHSLYTLGAYQGLFFLSGVGM